jgi:histidinol dehydrogenase
MVPGDYMADSSHTLPTGGAGASFSGLKVDPNSNAKRAGWNTIAPHSEGAVRRKNVRGIRRLGAHGKSAEIRK